MSYCRTKGSSLENQPRCIITLIRAYLTWLIKKEARGTVSIWRTNHFLQGGKLEDSTVTCLEGRTVREKKEETEGIGTEEEKLRLDAAAWGRGGGLRRAPGVSSCLPVSLGTLRVSSLHPSVHNWPPPHPQGQQSPSRAFPAPAWRPGE